MARWINVKKPFDYRWPDRSAVTVFGDADLRDHFVKDELADFAVQKGYASEGKRNASSRSKKGRAAKKDASAAKATDTRRNDGVALPDMADDDRADDRRSMDSDAGER